MATALAVYHLKSGRDKAYVRSYVLEHFYPDWALKGYADIHDDYVNDTTCQGTVPAALICFLESKDYVDCIKLAISLGGDADTLAAIAGSMAYAFYRSMPDNLQDEALAMLPEWMRRVNSDFDAAVSL